MLYLLKRKVEQIFVYEKDGKFFNVKETMEYNFDENKYRLVDFQFEEKPQLEGGDK